MISESVAARLLTPDTPEEIKIRLGSDHEFRELAKLAARKRYNAMTLRQQALKQDLDSFTTKSVNGLGQHYMRIDAEMYYQMRTIYGEECWDDPEFVQAFHDDPRNEYCRVRTTRGTKGQELLK